MGILGILLSVCIIAIGGWYVYFGQPHPPLIVENPDMPTIDTESVSGARALIGQARDLKSSLEEKAKGTMQQAEDTANGTVSPGAPTTIEKTGGDTKINIIDRLVNFGFSVPTKARTIDTIVLHSSYDAVGSDPYSVEGVIQEWKDVSVAPHYMIDRKGNIYRLVEDKNIAYHAGVSKMPDGRTNVNDFSIGIEILNTQKGQYTNAEYAAVNNLVAYLKSKYTIKSVVGHSDIAPGRKTDPWNFDWKKMK